MSGNSDKATLAEVMDPSKDMENGEPDCCTFHRIGYERLRAHARSLEVALHALVPLVEIRWPADRDKLNRALAVLRGEP